MTPNSLIQEDAAAPAALRLQACEQIDRYQRVFPEERERLDQLLAQLSQEREDLGSRKNMRGHITTTAIVLDPDRREVLLILHSGLGRWLPPGGHYERPADAVHVPHGYELLHSAVREAAEETGLQGARPVLLSAGQIVPLDIDSHPIPARPQRSEGPHVHHDFAYLVLAGAAAALKPQPGEVEALRWAPLAELEGSVSRRQRRIAAKLKRLAAAGRLEWSA